MKPEITYKIRDLETKQIFSREKEQPQAAELKVLEEQREQLLQILFHCYEKAPPPIRKRIREAISSKGELTRKQIEEEAENVLRKQLTLFSQGTISLKKAYDNILYQESLEANRRGQNMFDYKKEKLEGENLQRYKKQLQQRNHQLKEIVEDVQRSNR